MLRSGGGKVKSKHLQIKAMQQKQKQILDIEHLSKKDQKALLAILDDPVAWGELFMRNRDGSPRSFWEHQKDDLRCQGKQVVHQDGRDVGKSVCIVTDVLHYAFVTKGGSGLVAAPHQGHLDTLIEEFEFQLGENPDLMSAIAEGHGDHPAITRKPYFKATFISGTTIYFRPGGDYGKAFRSLHVNRVWVDEAAWLTGVESYRSYPRHMRRIRYKEKETGKWLVFLTNNLDIPAQTVADLYKHRWKIELFFKWIKQHLRIKVFYGTSDNAVKTQIWTAIAVYVLVAIVRKRLKIQSSLYTMLQVFSINLFEKVPINQVFTNEDYILKNETNPNQLSLLK